MATIFDLIASLVFSGACSLLFSRLTIPRWRPQATSHGDMLVQQMLINVAQMVEGEFRNMGFGVPENQKTVLLADTSSITFLTDMDRSGNELGHRALHAWPRQRALEDTERTGPVPLPRPQRRYETERGSGDALYAAILHPGTGIHSPCRSPPIV